MKYVISSRVPPITSGTFSVTKYQIAPAPAVRVVPQCISIDAYTHVSAKTRVMPAVSYQVVAAALSNQGQF